MKQYWEIKRLIDVCEELFAGGDVPKNNFSKNKTERFNIPIFSNGMKNKGLYGYTDIKKVTKPSITISARGTIGYSEIREENFYPVIRLIVLIPKREILSLRFLHHVVSSIDFSNSGTSIPQLTVPMVKKYTIPLPPIPEQRRIVEILDKAFAAIDKAKANAQKNLQNSRELFESYLNKVFAPSASSGQRNPGEDWEEKKLVAITAKIGSGATPKGGKKSYKTEGVSLIRSLNVYDREFRKKNLAFINEEQAKKLSNVILFEGDVLLNITGASVARCCVVPSEYIPARVNQHVSIIRLKNNIISPKLLSYLLTSKVYKDKLLKTGEKGGATRQAITKAQIEEFSILFPTRNSEQQKIVDKIDSLLLKSKKLETIYQQKLVDLEELKTSILQKAFNGEL